MGISCESLSVVVTSWRTRDYLRLCLDSLSILNQSGAQVIVVDDAGGDGSAEMVASEFPWVQLIALDQNVGYSVATNLGAAQARGEFLFLLNADTELRPGCAEHLMEVLSATPGCRSVAPRLVGADGETQATCMAFPKLATAFFFGTPLERYWPNSPELQRYFMREFDHAQTRPVPQAPTAALLLARECWQSLGGFDEAFGLFFGDVDLAKRLGELGAPQEQPTLFVHDAVTVHQGGASTRQLDDFVSRWHGDRLTYFRKHHGALAALWVKLCTSGAWLAHVLGLTLRRLRGEPSEPIRPLCRSFARFLAS